MEMLNRQFKRTEFGKGQFNLNGELNKHAWYPNMTPVAAEQALKNQPPYTYLLRKTPNKIRKYDISFVRPDGSIHHDTFTLINPKYGIWLNGHPSHCGSLVKVIRDMMDCPSHVGQPL